MLHMFGYSNCLLPVQVHICHNMCWHFALLRNQVVHIGAHVVVVISKFCCSCLFCMVPCLHSMLLCAPLPWLVLMSAISVWLQHVLCSEVLGRLLLHQCLVCWFRQR